MTPETRKATSSKKSAGTPPPMVKQAVEKAAKKQTITRKKGDSQTQLTPEERYRLIQESAYYMAEKAGFNGNSVDYWLAAEQEINTQYR